RDGRSSPYRDRGPSRSRRTRPLAPLLPASVAPARSSREAPQEVLDPLGQSKGLIHRTLPHVPPEDQAGRALLHRKTRLVEEILVADLAAATEEDHRLPCRIHDPTDPGF